MPLDNTTQITLSGNGSSYKVWDEFAGEEIDAWRFLDELACIAPPPPEPRRPDIPLPGDMLEALAKLVGADRLAQWFEQKTGKPCGCAERRDAINRLSAKLSQWWTNRKERAVL